MTTLVKYIIAFKLVFCMVGSYIYFREKSTNFNCRVKWCESISLSNMGYRVGKLPTSCLGFAFRSFIQNNEGVGCDHEEI